MTLQEQRDILARFIAYRNGELALLNQEADDLLDQMHLVYPVALDCMNQIINTPKEVKSGNRIKASKGDNDE